MRKLICTPILLLFISFCSYSQVSTCNNADFEVGDFSAWQGETGYCCPINTTVTGLVSGRHTIMTGTGTDPNTCNVVPVVAPGGVYSARLGNDNSGSEAEKLSYTLTVSASNSLFIYKYAVVLEDPGHSVSEQPRFQLRVLDAAGALIDPTCGEYTVVSGGSIPGFQTCGGSIRYKNWTTVGLDLTPYLGQTITMEFATGDCSLGGHYGYAYVDAYFSPLAINTAYCTGSFSAVLTAPIGFSYVWNTGATTRSINVTSPVNGQVYTCQLTSVTGCTVNISTILQPADDLSIFSLANTCFTNATFSNTSFTPPNTSFTNYLWNFGDSTTDTVANPVHAFPTSGTYNVSLTVTNTAGCSNTSTQTVSVIIPPTATISYPSASYCNSVTTVEPVTLTGTSAYLGGTYSSAPGLTIDPTTGAITPLTSTPGIYVVSYQMPLFVNCLPLPQTTIVTIKPIPVATATATPTGICSQQSTNIALTSNAPATTYTWTAAQTNVTGTTSGSGSNISQVLTTTSSLVGTATYTILPFANGCNGLPTNIILPVTPIPVATATPALSAICSGTVNNIALTADVLGTTFTWTVVRSNVSGATAGSGTSISQILTATSNSPGTAVYTITPFANGCPGTPVSTTITVRPTPVATATAAITTMCSGYTTAISLTSNVAGTTFTWTANQTNVLGAMSGNGTTISEVLNSTASTAGTVVYTITPSAFGCAGAPINFTMNVRPALLAVATPTPASFCSGGTTNILLSSNDPGTTYSWTAVQTDVSGATSGTGSTISQLLNATGNINGTVVYSVTPTANGCIGATITTTVTVKPIPVATSTPATQTICSKDSTNIALTSNVAGTVFNWTVTQPVITGAVAGNGNNISQILSATGSLWQTVIYNVTPSMNGCTGTTLAVPVVIVPRPLATASPSTQNVCSGTTTSIALSSNMLNTTYTWTVAQTDVTGAVPGAGFTIAQQLSCTGNIPGYVVYTITPDVNGCPGPTIIATVSVYPIPVVTANPADQNICSGRNTNIHVTGNVLGTIFSWTVTQSGVTGASNGSGDTIIQALTTIGIAPGSAEYMITPYANGCYGIPLRVIVFIKPTPKVLPATPATICSGQVALISLSSDISGAAFSWSVNQAGVTGASNGIGNTISQTLSTIEESVGSATYTVIPSYNGCMGLPYNAIATVNPLPVPKIEDGAICFDEVTGAIVRTYTLDTHLSNASYNFVWYFANSTTPISGAGSSTLVANQIGQYSVVATNSSTNCVSNLVSANVISSFPGLTITTNESLFFTNNASVTITVTGGNGIYEYQLDGGPFQQSNVFTNLGSGTHHVNVIDTFGCTNLSAVFEIVQYPYFFTPNGDGYNDTWNISDLDYQANGKIIIYDRHGKMIKQLDTAGQGWDGTYNGEQLPSSDYWFIVYYEETGVSKEFKSHFSLKR